MNGLPLMLFDAEKYTIHYLSDPQNERCDNPVSPGPRKKKKEEVNTGFEDMPGDDEGEFNVEEDFKKKIYLSGKSTLF